MVAIYNANFKGSPLSCSLLPYGAGIYLDAIVQAYKDIKTMEDYDQVEYYRKIERSFVDDRAGTVEMSKAIAEIIKQWKSSAVIQFPK